MARPVVTFFALLIAALPLPAATAAGSPQPPLRRLVYTTRYSVTSTRTQHVSGLSGGANALGTATASNSSSAASANAGTLTIDVVAFDPTGALVADASLRGDRRSQTPIRVAILPDGQLGVDPKADLSDEARRVLPLLAASFVGGREIAPSATWTVALGNPPTGSRTVRVTDVHDDRAQLQVDADVRAGGIANFRETSHAEVLYLVRVLAPASYDVAAHIRRTPALDVDEAAELRLTATLVSDSLTPRT
jgi:hypothetical protein